MIGISISISGTLIYEVFLKSYVVKEKNRIITNNGINLEQKKQIINMKNENKAKNN